MIACVAAVSFPFPGGQIEQVSGRAKERAWGEQKSGETFFLITRKRNVSCMETIF